MFAKYLIVALSSALMKVRGNPREDIPTMIHRLLVGFVVVAVVIFSLFQLGGALHTYLSRLDNGLALEVAAFGFVVVSGLGTLHLLFKRPSSRSRQREAELPANLQGLVRKFVAGFAEGLTEGGPEGVNEGSDRRRL
jgi:hypothetical protein